MTMNQGRAWIGLGGNLGDVEATLASAREELRKLSSIELVISPLYRSDPWGIEDQPAFLNQVVGIQPLLDPLQTLGKMLEIERAHGRIRGEKWGPRTLDLDLLSWPKLTMDTNELVLPHPRLSERGFVLAPWADVAPELIPFGHEESVSELLCKLTGSGWQPLSASLCPVSQ